MEQEFADLEGNVDAEMPAQMEELETGNPDGDDIEIEIEGDEPEGKAAAQQAQQEEEGDDEPPEANAGEEVDEDLKPYGRKMQKRIMRERKIARQAKAERDAMQSERDAERARRMEVEAHLVTSAETNIDAQIAEKKQALKSAKESGDTDAELSLMDDLDQLRADKRTVQSAKEAQPEKPAAEVPAKPAPQLKPLTQQWLNRNKWMGDPRFAAQINATRAIDSQMAAEGFDPNEPDYFDELDRRISESVKVPTTAKPQAPRPPARQSPVTGAGDGGDAAPRSRTKVVLTKSDLEVMTRVGLDPRNKAHLREFAMNKMSGGN